MNCSEPVLSQPKDSRRSEFLRREAWSRGTRLRDATAERMLVSHLATLLNCSQLDTSDDPAKTERTSVAQDVAVVLELLDDGHGIHRLLM